MRQSERKRPEDRAIASERQAPEPGGAALGGAGAPVGVTVRYLSVLRDRAGLRQEAVAFPGGSRLADLARWLEEHHGFVYGDRQLMFILNGRGWGQYPRGLETPLGDGDTVLLSMPISGG
jgi:molybdopterin converting factor small subunit